LLIIIGTVIRFYDRDNFNGVGVRDLKGVVRNFISLALIIA